MTTAKEKKLNETRLTWFLMGVLLGLASCSMVYYQYLQENITGGFAITLGIAISYSWITLFSWIAGIVGYKHGQQYFHMKFRLFMLLAELNCAMVMGILGYRYFEHGYSFWAWFINAAMIIPFTAYIVYSFDNKANREEERLRRILQHMNEPDEERREST